MPSRANALVLRREAHDTVLAAGDAVARGAHVCGSCLEYALILVLIAIVMIVVLRAMGQQVNNVFANISNAPK